MTDNQIKRLNYFHGQFLDATDFVDEQKYHCQLLQLHNLHAHSWGIVHGLWVSDPQRTATGATIIISPGMATDNQGHQLVVQTPIACEIPADAESYVTLEFHHEQSQTETQSFGGEQKSTRVNEWPAPRVWAGQTPPEDGSVIILAKFVPDGAGKLVTNAMVRRPGRVGGVVLSDDQGGSVELGTNQETLRAGTPYIDFHYAGRREDFNARIINDGDRRLSFKGVSSLGMDLGEKAQLKISSGTPADGEAMIQLELRNTVASEHRPLTIRTTNAQEPTELYDWTVFLEKGNRPTLAIANCARTPEAAWRMPLKIHWDESIEFLNGDLQLNRSWLPNPAFQGVTYPTRATFLCPGGDNYSISFHTGTGKVALVADGPIISTESGAYFAGSVGIGTHEPVRRLQIGSDVSGIGLDPADASPNAGYIRFGDNTGWKLHFGRSREKPGGPPNTGSAAILMTVQDNGNVGIGTVEPMAKLEVDGQVYIKTKSTGNTGTAMPTLLSPKDAKLLLYHSKDQAREQWAGIGVDQYGHLWFCASDVSIVAPSQTIVSIGANQANIFINGRKI